MTHRNWDDEPDPIVMLGLLFVMVVIIIFSIV